VQKEFFEACHTNLGLVWFLVTKVFHPISYLDVN
jgi:hypothetical protein